MEALAALPPGLTATTVGDRGLEAWEVTTPACRALVSRQGAQVLAFQATGQPPLLWLSPRAAWQPGKAIRGGIPLCFPWFGPHPDDAGKPAHGFARIRDWTLATARQAPDALELEFNLGSDAATRALWPHDFAATLRMRFSTRLALQLVVTNTGESAFRPAFAFHSYFPLADSRHAHVQGLDGSVRIDQLAAGRPRRRQAGVVRFEGETDLVFLHARGDYRLADELDGRSVHLAAPGCRSVIAWNPGAEKTARLADMPPDAWSGMACVECGNVEDDSPELPPGATQVFELVLEQ